ncbi:transposase [Patescibacteria group bacterium]|nr:transposase [Patescibacteria group bacterium]MBU4353276.1 transposase [Patescibacteria group bacterium]MBU4477379.1 transposase [Patescibacteria group bacterium]MCG2699434.1 transposase [Candidatus Parcubacteria bacterium]
MRKIKISVNEHYHIFNRGNNKQNIFLDERDYVRMLFLILHLQSPLVLQNMSRPVSNFVKSRAFNISKTTIEKIIKNRYVELINFTLMPNHFHISIRELKEDGISQYMQRILTAYTKYFNAKYGKSGHLFQGPFQIVHIEDNEQLLHLSAYIHRNPREIKEWKNKEHQYTWSSYQDCITENRWKEFLKHQIITGQFSDKKEYQSFVKTSGTKLELGENC